MNVQAEKQPLISSKDLPMPRIELRWEHDGTQAGWGEYRRKCQYLLIMPIWKQDIRTDANCANAEGTALEFEMCVTDCSGGQDPRVWLEECRIDTPFRDGRHAQWDSHVLRMPAYATCGEWAMLIEPEAPPSN